MKKVMSFIVGLSLLFTTGTFVKAETVSHEETGIYVDGTYVSEGAKKFIEDNGIELEENDQVEVVKSEGTSRSIPTTALHVLKRDGSETEEYFLLSYEEQENGDVVPADVPLETSMARGSQSITYTPGYAKLISIVGTVGYTTEGDLFTVYIKPTNTTFKYSYNQSCTVNYINTSFQTEGTLCSSSGSEISSEYVHAIEIYQNNPVAGTTYQKSSPLPSGRKIKYTGNINSGTWLTFEAKVNGSWDSRTYSMKPVS